ncbi:DBR1 domain-containing protein [Mycena kentingensis (nom. inval.)]|nr:DBR1 domain-containing protein [Mycena kentingensis (nom. inval.)]
METRAPPPTGAGRWLNRTYRTNLRPIVIVVAFISALWALTSYVPTSRVSLLSDRTLEPYASLVSMNSPLSSFKIGFFRSISIENGENAPKLATFAIVIGALYTGLFAIEAFGVLAASLQRAGLVRLYAMASFGGIAIAAGVGIFRVIVHFTSKSDIIRVCTSLTTGARYAVYPFGFWGPSRHEILDADDAASWCNHEYSQDSWQLIISLLFTIFLYGSFSALAWAYYRQVLDPTSVINNLRAPSHQYQTYPAPTHYNPAYGAPMPNLGYNAPYGGPPGGFAPPPGPPPTNRDLGSDASKPPGYAGGQPGYGQDDKENPFADFDERTERDVTSRPAPGGPTSFN